MNNWLHEANYVNVNGGYIKNIYQDNILQRTITVFINITDWAVTIIEFIDSDIFNSIKSSRFSTVNEMINNFILT